MHNEWNRTIWKPLARLTVFVETNGSDVQSQRSGVLANGDRVKRLLA